MQFLFTTNIYIVHIPLHNQHYTAAMPLGALFWRKSPKRKIANPLIRGTHFTFCRNNFGSLNGPHITQGNNLITASDSNSLHSAVQSYWREVLSVNWEQLHKPLISTFFKSHPLPDFWWELQYTSQVTDPRSQAQLQEYTVRAMFPWIFINLLFKPQQRGD